MSSTRTFWLFSAAFLLAVVSAVTVKSFQSSDSITAPAATYVQGVLHTDIFYRAARSGAGVLRIELLNPEDEVLAHSERRVDLRTGVGLWHDELRLNKPLPVDELVWHRLRYSFAYDNPGTDREIHAIRGIESVSDILRFPTLRIVGQQTWLSGAPAAVRVIVSDSSNAPIPGLSSVAISLHETDGKALPLYNGKLDARGTAEAVFHAPAGLTGTFPVQYTADTPLGPVEYTQQVRLEDQVSTLLTTEKPIYQPGQTIHIRALALNRANHEAVAARKLTFELEDSRGNKIFRQATQTSPYGVASAEFSLADEVNLGTWHLRALLEDQPGSQHPAELALSVQRYVLPKFKVAIDFADNDRKTKRGYRPSDHVTGTVRANYFFGKPVDNAAITVAATAPDLGATTVSDLASVKGTTDNDGAYRFDLRLPDYFAGRPLDHGVARVAIEARVKDNAAHSESHTEPITVSESPLLLTAVPESGALMPNLENRIFIVASYPDGTPAGAEVSAELPGNPAQNAATDAGGVAIVQFTAGQSDTLKINATDHEGNHASTTVKLDARAGQDQLLLRSENAVYKIGDRIHLRVFSTKRRAAAYIDIVREGQTIQTRDVDLANGTAELTIPVTGDMSGTLDCDAYLFGSNGQAVADHRLVFVQPADELKVETATDAAEYKPGGEARIRFKVTNSRGQGVQAALGVQAVDEAVFALAEKQPGFAKIFFYLEQEAMKPRYEIHSIGMPDVVQPVETTRADHAAQALFAATEMVNPNRFETKAGGSSPVTKLAEYRSRYQIRFMDRMHVLGDALTRAYAQNSEGGDLLKVVTHLADSGAPELRDALGRELAIQQIPFGPQTVFMVSDRGSGQMGNFAAFLNVKSGEVTDPGSPRVTVIQSVMEHNRGAVNGLAQVTGTVSDPTAAVVPNAPVTLTNRETHTVFHVASDPEGRFAFYSLAPGKYDVAVSVAGFVRAEFDNLILVARDRAVLSARLKIGSVTETITVEAAGTLVMNMAGAARGGGGGGMDRFNRTDGTHLGMRGQMAAAGGVLGGIIGGVPMARPPLAKAVAAPMPRLPVVSEPEPHTRSWFPEALYINPEIITDANGAASIAIPIADSITTWRIALLASTTQGALGSGSASIKVFQDFFTDLDLPVTLTQGDRVEIPIAIYNYTGAGGPVNLKLAPADWYSLVQDSGDKTVSVDSGRVGAASFSIEAQHIGKFKLTLSSRIAGPGNHADIVVREIEVVPNGREQNVVFNGHLDSSVEHQIDFPADAIPDASKLFVRLYPGPLSQVIEGMDAILRMPGGCFEQTSSSTYPNVLTLDYMKRTNKVTPEIHAKAEGFIASGYQRLLTFEVPGGGFSWFGQAPANKILTAYGLMEFHDMAQVYDVDPAIIRRTQAWLASQQQPDGSWKPDTNFINEGATNRYNTGSLRITAYIAWALENTGYKGPAVEKARTYVENNMSAESDAYTKAVVANYAAGIAPNGPNAAARNFSARGAQSLLDSRSEKGDQLWWTAEETGVYGRGDSAAIETTGLAVQALLKSGKGTSEVRKALAWIAAKKDASGAWGTTQATIMALRALLLASSTSGADASGTVEVTVNGTPVQRLVLTADNSDLYHQFVFDAKSSSAVGIRFTGKGSLAYQVSGRYFVPWQVTSGVNRTVEPFSITVAYDQTRLAQDDIAKATATARNNLNESANIVMIDLGIPPGFDLLTEDLQDYLEKTATARSGRLEKFSLTATQAILYFDSIAARDTIRLPFRLRAKYPIRARTFQSRVYEYYQPEVNATAPPVQLEIVAKAR